MSYKEEILRLRAEGKTYNEIQRLLGCSKSTMSYHCGNRMSKPHVRKECKVCSNLVKSGYTYCTDHVQDYKKHQAAAKIQSWINGDWSGGSNYGLSDTIRFYLLSQSDYKCSKCGFNTPHPDDNKTILEINHINGDGTDHSPENLEVVCPNCHALTSSYRGRNQGSGRPQYYIRRSKT